MNNDIDINQPCLFRTQGSLYEIVENNDKLVMKRDGKPLSTEGCYYAPLGLAPPDQVATLLRGCTLRDMGNSRSLVDSPLDLDARVVDVLSEVETSLFHVWYENGRLGRSVDLDVFILDAVGNHLLIECPSGEYLHVSPVVTRVEYFDTNGRKMTRSS